MTNCYLHPGKPSVKTLNVPCVPGGKIWICKECADCAEDTEFHEAVWNKYKAEHNDRVKLFKTPGNPNN